MKPFLWASESLVRPVPDGEVGPAAQPCSLDFTPPSTPCLLKQAESLYWLKEVHRAVHVFPEESQVINVNGGVGATRGRP